VRKRNLDWFSPNSSKIIVIIGDSFDKYSLVAYETDLEYLIPYTTLDIGWSTLVSWIMDRVPYIVQICGDHHKNKKTTMAEDQ
jgi:hypothetical protein